MAKALVAGPLPSTPSLSDRTTKKELFLRLPLGYTFFKYSQLYNLHINPNIRVSGSFQYSKFFSSDSGNFGSTYISLMNTGITLSTSGDVQYIMQILTRTQTDQQIKYANVVARLIKEMHDANASNSIFREICYAKPY